MEHSPNPDADVIRLSDDNELDAESNTIDPGALTTVAPADATIVARQNDVQSRSRKTMFNPRDPYYHEHPYERTGFGD